MLKLTRALPLPVGLASQATGSLAAQWTGLPVGGNAVLILNQELRFPLFSIIDGAGFVDVGNVYPQVSDFDPFHLRSSAGLGVRVHTPYFLFRLDYGVKLDRRPGESFGKLFISIGQAF